MDIEVKYTYSFEIYDKGNDMSVEFRNLDIDTLNLFTHEEVVNVVFSQKFYNFGMYDKINFIDKTFMILKNTKKNVILLAIQSI